MSKHAEAAEKWVYAGAHSHGKLERQVLAMVARIRELGITDVKIELQSEETFRLRGNMRILTDALAWIGAIAVAPRESWPTHEVIASVANEALAALKGKA